MAAKKNRKTFEEIENVFIPMPDGTRIAARVWLPAGAREKPVPAILEFIPYRKRDLMRRRDEGLHRYFAENGYAVIRADIRGSGDSEGILEDEYTKQEQDDAVSLIDWASKQKWCSGNVGMMGISWGGFNALQVAARQPPALKAIITLCSTDDRYADDVHYMGGALLLENMQWGSIMTMYNAYPPDPEIVGRKNWRKMWRQRLEAVHPLTAHWMKQQHRGDYWKHGSVCEDFSKIKCPVYAVGGWADGYSNAVPRLLAGLDVPRKGLVGPWAHAYPHNAIPGPEIGFLQEAVRWWDKWLKGIENGIMDEPQYRIWMEDWVTPQPDYTEKPGRWVAEKKWPSPCIERKTLHLGDGKLSRTSSGKNPVLSVTSPPHTGMDGGVWCGMGHEGEAPVDQRGDDSLSLTFDGAPLRKRLEIMGAPEVELEIKSDVPAALASVRLCDIAPDGSVLRVTYGILNLAHRAGHDKPAFLEPGKWTKVRIKMNDCAYAFPEGHRIRLSLSNAYWPIVWPSPQRGTLSVRTGKSALTLPVRPPRPEDKNLRVFDPPARGQTGETVVVRKGRHKRETSADRLRGETIFERTGDGGDLGGAAEIRLPDIKLNIGYSRREKYVVRDGDSLSARAEFDQVATFRRAAEDAREGKLDARIRLDSTLTSTARNFTLSADLRCYDNKNLFFRRKWKILIPRNYL